MNVIISEYNKTFQSQAKNAYIKDARFVKFNPLLRVLTMSDTFSINNDYNNKNYNRNR